MARRVRSRLVSSHRPEYPRFNITVGRIPDGGARQVKFVVGLLVGLAIAGAAFSYFYSVPAHCGPDRHLDTSVDPLDPLAQPRASRFGVMKWKDE